ncbi:MAG: hypothetical protein R3E79_03490 [Caldilineaceae bacterium]
MTTFDFFASGLGILAIGAIAVAMLLFWDWRLLLLGVGVIQLGVVVLVTKVHQASLEWVQVQMFVIILCMAICFLSARQIRIALAYQRPGSWLIRVMAVTLLLVCWRLFDFELTLPVVAPPVARLFVWLSVCALVMLGLGDAPLSTGVALLLWLIPVQGVIQILLPEFRLFVLIGIIQILSTLACSYLMLTARQPTVTTAAVSTDIAFPTPARRALPPPPNWVEQPPRLLPGSDRQQPIVAPLTSEPPVAPRKAV